MRRATQRIRVLYNHVTAEHHEHNRERRLTLLIRHLPKRVRNALHWLRQPSARWVRIPAGTLLIFGGVLFILPVFGLWMLPLGLILLSEDIPPLRRLTDRWLYWIEEQRPHWMGLPLAPSSPSPSPPKTGSA
jgi:hypothetical protein